MITLFKLSGRTSNFPVLPIRYENTHNQDSQGVRMSGATAYGVIYGSRLLLSTKT